MGRIDETLATMRELGHVLAVARAYDTGAMSLGDARRAMTASVPVAWPAQADSAAQALAA